MIEAAAAALDRWGTGAGASRLICGSRPIHGQLETDPEVLASIDAPVLGVFADKDGWINPALVEEFEALAEVDRAD